MDEVLGEIRMFAGTYAPPNWALCAGQSLSISGNEDLFALLGTMYGGDGASCFKLPDMRGRIPMGDGTGPGLTTRQQGAMPGTETVTLATNEIPSHTHYFMVSTDVATYSTPIAGNHVGNTDTAYLYQDYASTMASKMRAVKSSCLSNAGQNYSHNNIMPCLCVNFIICTRGIYPQES